MELQIRSNGVKLTDGLREYVDTRMKKLDKLVENVVDAQLELRTAKVRSGTELTTAQLTVQTGRHILRAEVRDNDATKAIDQVIDKLERQIRKFRDKQKNRKSRVSVSNLSVAAVAPDTNGLASEAEDEADIDASRLVRTKRFAMKPMSVDEAIDQLELIGHDFYLFLNADEEQLNVLYRRRDGTYGLLGPDPL
jgi:putative sigma-54 modulation protein